MKKYYIWTEGCQMNVADSLRGASALEQLGYEETSSAETADVIVLNTCVVRQSAENKAYGRLNSLRPLKAARPDIVICLMGCLFGVKGNQRLRERFPFVDVFAPPSDFSPLVELLSQPGIRRQETDETARRFAWMDGEVKLPARQRGNLVSAYIAVMDGCSHACTYCVIPYRRGAECSRPPEQIIAEARALAAQGVREITLLGQIVDRYGLDRSGYPGLSELLKEIHQIEGLERIRFLTSHPNWMTDDLMDAVEQYPRLMPHIEVPVQAGDDTVLNNMRRGYTAQDYRRLVERIRRRIPHVSIATDIIVGFPGESEAQFQKSYQLLADLKLDVAHLARYSPRPDTVATRTMADDVPAAEKLRRFRLLEELQEGIAAEIHARYMGQSVTVLFEEKVKKRWKGRTPNNELVFTESEEDLRGKVLPVKINWTGPWSMIGELGEDRGLSLVTGMHESGGLSIRS
jgi:tRNA-2-methylthio-N6-dimethylallyladenosine synthase